MAPLRVYIGLLFRYLSNGVLRAVQWGMKKQSGDKAYSVAFPLAFSTCLNVTCGAYGTTYEDITPVVGSTEPTKFTYYCGSGCAGCWYIAAGK